MSLLGGGGKKSEQAINNILQRLEMIDKSLSQQNQTISVELGNIRKIITRIKQLI